VAFTSVRASDFLGEGGINSISDLGIGALDEEEGQLIAALIIEWIGRQMNAKEGGAFRQYQQLTPPCLV